MIDSVRLLVRYDRILRPYQFRTLQIATQPQRLFPYFAVGPVDRWGRRDGVGELYRTYESGQTVNVTAPFRRGHYEFVLWTDGAGNTITANPQVPVLLNSNTKRIAQYAYTGPLLNVADFNEDYWVDFYDFSVLTRAWRAESGDPDWVDRYDIYQDGIIDLLDLLIFSENWMEEEL